MAFDAGNGVPVNWNDITGDASGNGTFTNLIDESGGTTGVNVTVQGYVAPIGSSLASTVPSHSNGLSALNSYAQPAWNEDSLIISNLDSDTVYKVWAIGLGGGSAPTDYSNNWTISGATTTSFVQTAFGGQLSFNSEVGDSARSFDSYAIELKPDAGGQITFDVTNPSPQRERGKIAGIAIEATGSAPPLNVDAVNLILQSGDHTINGGETLTVPQPKTLLIQNDRRLINDGTIENDWIVNSNHNGTIENNGIFINNRAVNSAGDFINSASGTYNNNAGSATVQRSGQQFLNDGTVTNKGVVTVLQSSRFTNNNSFTNDGGRVQIYETAVFDGTGIFTQIDGSLIVNGVLKQAEVNIVRGTLSGAGTIIGDVTIGDGAIFAPGNSPGTLEIDGDLIIGANSIIQIQIGATGATSDLIRVTGGSLTILDGAIIELVFTEPDPDVSNIDILDFFDITPEAGDDAIIVEAAVNLSNVFKVFTDLGTGSPSISGIGTGAVSASIDVTANASPVNLVNQVDPIPEPGTLALFASGLLGLGAIGRRRRRKD